MFQLQMFDQRPNYGIYKPFLFVPMKVIIFTDKEEDEDDKLPAASVAFAVIE